ncbi:translation elongation factor Ts [soil metagenome]
MIKAEQVKELRELTGAGMMECKNALVESNGDLEEAVVYLRKKGQTKADRKAGRVAAEGIIIVLSSADNRQAVMIEINSETDFVARDENFRAFANAVIATALQAKVDGDIAKLLAMPLVTATEQTIEQARQALVAKVGENINVRRVAAIQTDADGVVGSYVHMERIGVLVELKGGDLTLAKDIAMHIAASNPLVIDPKEVSAELLAKEKEIYSAQARESGKPEAIIEKMIEGRVAKFLQEVSLLGQPFVKEPTITIGDLLKSKNATAVSFVRYGVGEGIEKVVTNFAEEVMAQVKG